MPVGVVLVQFFIAALKIEHFLPTSTMNSGSYRTEMLQLNYATNSCGVLRGQKNWDDLASPKFPQKFVRTSRSGQFFAKKRAENTCGYDK